MGLWEVTPDLASESGMPLFEPGTEVLIKTFGSGGQSLEPLWEGPYQMGLIISVTLLLLTPKVPSLPSDPQDNAFLSWLIPMPHSTIGLGLWSIPLFISGSFPRWTSPLQGKHFCQV